MGGRLSHFQKHYKLVTVRRRALCFHVTRLVALLTPLTRVLVTGMAPAPRKAKGIPVNTTSATSSVAISRHIPKAKCNSFKALIAQATWFNAEIQNHGCLETTRNVANGFLEHLNSICKCTAHSSTKLIIASTYLHEFHLLSKNVIDQLDTIERVIKEKAEAATSSAGGVGGLDKAGIGGDGSKKADSYKSDFDEKLDSKFVSSFNDQISGAHFKHLIKPAINSLIFYEKALIDDETEKFLNQRILNTGFVLANLNALFNIFVYYELPNFAFRAADTACRFAERFYPNDEPNGKISLTSHEEVQVTYCNMIRLLLSFGCLETATAFFKRHFVDAKLFANTKNIDTFGQGMIFLVSIELFLRLRKSNLYGEKLKEFLNSDYFTKNTIKRYSLKIMTLLLASRFPSAVYKFTHNFAEFTEPLQMAISVCKRWKMFSYFFRTIPAAIDDQADPLWYRYMIFNLVSETGTVITHFYNNSGLVNDAAFYYKIILNLNVITMNVIGIAKTLLLAADFDFKNGFSDDAKTKLLTTRNLFISSPPFNANIFQPLSSKLTTFKKTNANKSIIGVFEVDSDFRTASMITNTMSKYYQTIAATSKNALDNVNDLVKAVLEEFDLLQQHGLIFHNLFYVATKLIAIKQMINYQESVNDYAVNQCSQLLSLLENFTIKCHFEIVQKIVKNGSFVTNITTNIMEQLIHGPCATYFWHVISFYVKKMVDGQLNKEALCYLNKLVNISTFSFETRVSRCVMFYYRALVIYRFLKATFSATRKPILTIDSNKMLSCKLPLPRNATSDNPQKTSISAMSISSLNNEPEFSLSIRTMLNKNKCINKPTTRSARKKTSKKDNDDDVILLEHKNVVDNFSRLELDDASMNDINSIESYLAKEFNVAEFVNSFDLSTYSLEDVKASLNKVICYIGLHPSWSIYQDVHYMYFKLARANSKNNLVLLYHLGESAEHASYRYRNIIISQRKATLSKGSSHPFKPDFAYIQFKFDDFSYLPYANDLPKTWRFLQIKLCDNSTKYPDILFARFQSSRKPVFFKISTRDHSVLSKYFLEEFDEIMKGNNASMSEVVRQIYWKIRHEYDNRLIMLLQSFEDTYIGPFKSLLMGECDNRAFRAACSNFKKSLNSAATKLGLECVDIYMLDVFAESAIFLETEELVVGAKMLYNFEDHKLADSLKLSQIKRTYFKEWNTVTKITNLFKSVAPVGLILDSALAQFPLESLPTARKFHQPMFRVPSLRVASILYSNFKSSSILEKGIDDTNCYYVVNPSANLQQTDQFFRQKFHDISSVEKNWEGIIGREPTADELKSNLESKDMFIYFGHGSGSIYYRKVPNGGIDALLLKPTSIVIGCSSGRVWAEGKMEATYGVPYRFLVNGAPCYIGNLWDVTDKDIDMFSDKFLAFCSVRWKPDEEEKVQSLAHAISMSRDACRLKFLIGCAPVVYGLPLNIIQRNASSV